MWIFQGCDQLKILITSKKLNVCKKTIWLSSTAAVILGFSVWFFSQKSRRKQMSRCKDGPLNSTPQFDGFSMPAEWEKHQCTWMVWPSRPDVWRSNARYARQAFAAVAQAIGQNERVNMCVPPSLMTQAKLHFENVQNVYLVEIDSDDAWARDTAPLFVIKRTHSATVLRGVDFEFNAWGGLEGGCFYPWDKDNLVASKILSYAGVDGYKCDMVLEGGSVNVDGEGTLLTTRECLLNHNRNPHLSEKQIESQLKAYLGVDKVLWLNFGCIGDDDTNGHIDNFCCFARPGHVILHWTDDINDPQYPISLEALQLLTSFTDARGRRLTVHKLHMPGPLYLTDEEAKTITLEAAVERKSGKRLPASYVNFYFANNSLIVPGFGDIDQDQRALETFQEIFPSRQVIQVPSREILLGGGNIHCITQQQPSIM